MAKGGLIMTKTTNYNLNQWDAEDQVRREDFNADNAAIDAALKAVATTAANAGNLIYYTTSRHGTGGRSAITITVPKGRPLMLIVSKNNVSTGMVAIRGSSYPAVCTAQYPPIMTWADKSVTWNQSADIASNFDETFTGYYIVVISTTD